MDYTGTPGGEDAVLSLGVFADAFYRIDVFSPDEEDVCVHGAPEFLPDEATADILVHVRRGLPSSQVAERLLAIAIRAEEGLGEG